MREYRKRKRAASRSVLVTQVSSPSVLYVSEPSPVLQRITDRPAPHPARQDAVLVRQGACSSFKTALDLARPFPAGVLASRVCPYCYNTGISSPGTRCSYCQSGEGESAVRL